LDAKALINQGITQSFQVLELLRVGFHEPRKLRGTPKKIFTTVKVDKYEACS
jgi:hypothetical protein